MTGRVQDMIMNPEETGQAPGGHRRGRATTGCRPSTRRCSHHVQAGPRVDGGRPQGRHPPARLQAAGRRRRPALDLGRAGHRRARGATRRRRAAAPANGSRAGGDAARRRRDPQPEPDAALEARRSRERRASRAEPLVPKRAEMPGTSRGARGCAARARGRVLRLGRLPPPPHSPLEHRDQLARSSASSEEPRAGRRCSVRRCAPARLERARHAHAERRSGRRAPRAALERSSRTRMREPAGAPRARGAPRRARPASRRVARAHARPTTRSDVQRREVEDVDAASPACGEVVRRASSTREVAVAEADRPARSRTLDAQRTCGAVTAAEAAHRARPIAWVTPSGRARSEQAARRSRAGARRRPASSSVDAARRARLARRRPAAGSSRGGAPSVPAIA